MRSAYKVSRATHQTRLKDILWTACFFNIVNEVMCQSKSSRMHKVRRCKRVNRSQLLRRVDSFMVIALYCLFTRLQLTYKYRLIYHTVCKITLTFFMDFQNDCSWTLGFGQPINFNIWERLIRLKVKKDTTHSYTAQLFNALKVQGIVILSLKTLKVLNPLSVEECSEFDNLWLVEVFTACNHGNSIVTP